MRLPLLSGASAATAMHRSVAARTMQWCVIGISMLAVSTLPLSAQTGSGGRDSSTSGVVLDAATNQPLLRARVSFVAGTDTISATTNANGRWSLPSLPARQWTVAIRRVGYRPETVQALLPDQANPVATVRLAPLAISLDEVVVTGARRAQRLKDAVISTELVTRSDIERTGATDLASVLLEQTGIELQGGHPAGTGVMLQGIGSERVLILLDGQPVSGRIAGVFDVSRIPVQMVERVEVVKGPQSTLYGTEAMGGVINIITRTPEAGVFNASVTATAGMQERRDGAASVSYGRGPLAARFDVGTRTMEMTPGRSATTGALAARTDASFKVRLAPDSTRWLEASLLALDERQRWQSATLFNFGDNQQINGRIAGSWQRGRHRLSPTISTSVFNHTSLASRLPQPIAGDTGQRQVQRLHQAELVYSTGFGSMRPGHTDGAVREQPVSLGAVRHALDLGVQVRRDETQSVRVTGGLRSLTMIEPFAQLEVRTTDALSIVPGVRVSHSDLWGTYVTPRLAARWHVTDGVTLRASAGDGFRAPDFRELYMFFQNTSAGYAVFGNDDLTPESSRNLSVGAEWSAAGQYLRAQLFHNNFRDFIETRPITAPGQVLAFEFANVDNGVTRGVELETGLTRGSLRLEAAYNGLSTRDNATAGALLGRPTHSARTTVALLLPFNVRTSMTGLFTGRTPMQRDAETGVITSWRDAFTRVDMRLARPLPGSRAVELVLGVDNLFDTQPAQWAGFARRHVYTAFSMNFNNTSFR